MENISTVKVGGVSDEVRFLEDRIRAIAWQNDELLTSDECIKNLFIRRKVCCQGIINDHTTDEYKKELREMFGYIEAKIKQYLLL